jgi:ATP-dependent RNA helicase DDX52/ROK1
VIVAPTKELAVQIHREILKLGNGKKWKICLLTKKTATKYNFGGESSQKWGTEVKWVLLNLSFSRRFLADILVTSPLRLVHLIEHEEVKLNT